MKKLVGIMAWSIMDLLCKDMKVMEEVAVAVAVAVAADADADAVGVVAVDHSPKDLLKSRLAGPSTECDKSHLC